MTRARYSVSKSALAGLLFGVTALAAVAISGIGYRLGGWHFTVGLQVTEWAVYGAAFALALSAVGLFQARPQARHRGFVLAILGVAAALPVVAMGLQWEYATRTYPPINDISTDMEEAPVFWDMPNPTDYPGAETAALQRAAYPGLAPLELAMPPEKAFAHALAVAQGRGWEIVASVPQEGRIEATDSSFLYGFTDEITVRVAPSDGGARVDVRSRSRIGRIDRGVNAKRIRAYLKSLQAHAVTAAR
ncbi:MAG: DUF1499 domain-containing protein [Anderseniella sp.]|jgi:uncharacterized protein (DUF1499 family)|nr:DUF1499 domain-containing protein [Anderseniella sp.]